MKRTICLMLLGIMLCCCGCRDTKTENPPQINVSFCAAITIQNGTEVLQGIWDSTTAEAPVLVLEASEHRGELTYSQVGESLHLSFSGLEKSFPMTAFLQNTVPRCLFEVFHICRLHPWEEEPVRSGENWIFSGTYAELPFTIHTDAQGQLLFLTVGSQISAAFSAETDRID